MRTMLLVVAVVLVSGCSRPCMDACQGCCDANDTCHPGTKDAECGNGAQRCIRCAGGVTCSPTGFCVPRVITGGGGGATGGGTGGAGGGGGSASVFVALRFDHPVDNINGTCRLQTVTTCTVTKSVALARFQELRTSSLSTCSVTQTSTDGYTADCTGKCTSTDPGCVQANGVPRRDLLLSCTRIDRTADDPCSWTP